MNREEVQGQLSLYSARKREILPVDLLLQKVIAQAKALNIPVSEHINPSVRINKRATGRFGACFANKRNGTFLIVLHTCYGCQNHKKRWHRYADMMNQAYGYTITRTESPERLGVEGKNVVRYVVECTQCGAEIPRARRSRLVEHPEDYRCAKCGGQLALKKPKENGE